MNQISNRPVMIMAGGTGGHVFPALAVAEYLRAHGESIVWVGTRAGIEARVVPAADFAIEWLSIRGLRRKGMLALLFAPFKLTRACWQAFFILLRVRPRAVLGMGGFVAGPGGLMAWVLNIPLFLHEQNSIMGTTNRILSRFATRSYFGFPETGEKIPRSEYIGNPVRAELTDLPSPETRLSTRASAPMNLLVIGGSLGAVSLNRELPRAIAQIDSDQRPGIKHQCGGNHFEACETNYKKAGVEAEVFEFIDDMRSAYEWADLVVCRAGALTIAELTATGIASILIPFPYAVDNHQYHNARFLEQHQAARILTEEELSAESLALLLLFFHQNRDELIAMSVRARAQAKIDATENLGQGVLAGALS